MKFSDLIVTLPCTSLEDLSLDREAAEAEGILAAYSALWHPALVASARAAPRWVRAEDPPQDPAGRLVVIPGACEHAIPPDWPAQAEAAGACVVRGLEHRDAMVSAALAVLDGGDGGVDPDLAGDFLALGYGHLLVELLTRQLRYMSNLDEVRFSRETVSAAEAALQGEADLARDHLRAALDQLTEAREYFYPVEAHLLDLTLVAPNTLGASLRAELAGPEPVNLLLTGADLERMAAEAPETLAALRAAVEQGRAGLLGGGMDDAPLPLMPVEAVLEDLRGGLAVFERLLGRRPTVFGRRRFGLTPVLPQMLQSLGLEGAMHCTLDDGRFPSGNQSKVRWEGLDGTVIEALARIPLDVTRADNFLRLPSKLGDTLDLDHTATAVMAHWPGQSSPWLEDLKRISQFSSVVGRFVTVEHYFDQTRLAGQQKKYLPDEYRAPYLRQDVAAHQPDPISRWVRYHGGRARLDGLRTLLFLGDVISGEASAPGAWDALKGDGSHLPQGKWDPSPNSDLDGRMDDALQQALARLARALPRASGPEEEGVLVVNTASFTRRVWSETDGACDVPGPGFAWIGCGRESGGPAPQEPARPGWIRRLRAPKKREEPPLAEEHFLRNEFFEARLDPATGALRSLHDYRTRGSRFAQQLAMRIPQPRARGELVEEFPETDYTIMAADEFRVLSAGPARGEVEVHGRLMARDGTRAAGFTETLRCRRGSPLLEIEIELDVERLPEADPWNSYYACRFAWGDQTSETFRSANQLTCRTDARLLECPWFFDVRGEKTRTAVFFGGLPYHRRFGVHKLDTLLVVRGETARRFRLGIGVDVKHPMAGALDFLAPAPALRERASPPAGATGWFFHLDARNVIATAWVPLAPEGKVEGFRVRLLETEGRRAEAALRSFRALASARRVDFAGRTVVELAVEGDKAAVNLGPYQYAEVEAVFAP